jgi:outer membrane beta-barrel protein
MGGLLSKLPMNFITALSLLVLVFPFASARGAENEIEKQLEEIGRIQNEEVIVVQRKYTRKTWRHEFTPVMFGGMPFGTVRRTLFGGAGYTIHANDWLGIEALNFVYTKTFFSSFADDINNASGPSGNKIAPDIQQIKFIATTGVQFTPFYGKMSSLSRWIAYVEPYFSIGFGIAKTDVGSYFALAPGLGLRVFFREWLSMRLDFKDYLYNETTINRQSGAVSSRLTNNYTVMVSLSFWLPKMPR